MNDEQKIDKLLANLWMAAERFTDDIHKYRNPDRNIPEQRQAEARQALLALVSEKDSNLIDERDRLERNLDSLSDAVGAYFHKDLGKHSSANDPWFNAFEMLRDSTKKLATYPAQTTEEYYADGESV